MLVPLMMLNAVGSPPTLVILEWAKRLRTVSFTLASGHPIVLITATLTTSTGAVYTAAITATNATAATGLQLPPVPAGVYALALHATDQFGGTATAARSRVEVVNG